MKLWCITGAILLCSALGLAQSSAKKNPPPRSDQSQAQQSGESSSKDNKIDLSPPKGDDIQHADSDDESTDVMETKPWNPHKAAKDIEVGDFYAKRKNYRAAISRYREALEYKPKDAEALRRYQEYLTILPKGEFAKEAQDGIARLKAAKSNAR